MQAVNFEEALEAILQTDHRYQREAYLFLREALDYTHKMLGKSGKDSAREAAPPELIETSGKDTPHHVTPQELLEGIRGYALQQFGPMAITVLEEWGVQRCEDWGEIVFTMIEHNLLAKTDQDKREDFKARYDFFEAFRKPYLPPPRVVAPPVPETNPRT